MTFQGVTIQRPISVERTAKPLPPYQLDLSRQPLNGWMLTSIGLFVVVLALLGTDAVLFGSHFFRRLSGLGFSPAAAAVGNLLPHRPHMPRLPHMPSVHRDGLVPLATSTEPAAQTEPAVLHESPIPTPAAPPAEAATTTEPAPARPAPTPVHVGFNIKTTGDHVIPPSLRAIDNIQPLSLRRNHTPVVPLAPSPAPASEASPAITAVTKIAVSDTLDTPDSKDAPDTPKPKKHRTRKASKKPKVAISVGPIDTPPPPTAPTPET